METLQTILFVVQVLVALALIGFILIQHGKGADAGAAFGSGASSTVFGSRGSGNFLTKSTTVLAVIFLVNSMSLGYIATQRINAAGNQSLLESGLLDEVPAEEIQIPAIEDEIPAPVSSEIPELPNQ